MENLELESIIIEKKASSRDKFYSRVEGLREESLNSKVEQ